MSAWFQAASNGIRRVPRWAIGVAVATPVAATLQGCLMLQQYRRDHGHAPHPIAPSQGLVVVSPERSTAKTHRIQRINTTTKPLRLLVIGDSLAVGVGVSQSGTPILPQSIATALSSASNGRAVHWTCIGSPGASSSQIVQDLGAYQDSPSLLERKHAEWQVATRKAKEWWEQRKKLEEEQQQQQEEADKKNKNRVKQWWSRVRRDVDNLKGALNEIPQEVKIQTRLTRRKSTLDPDVAAQYDIAVVLTGINDLKDAFLPFMMKGKHARTDVPSESAGGMKDSLVNIVRALQSKMKINLPNNDDEEKKDQPTVATSPSNSHGEDSQQLHRGPLVVFPGMPASPLPLTHYPPLSWFLIPLINMMDNNKRLLAERLPGIVLYVDPPSAAEYTEMESGRVDKELRPEKILLQITNVTQRAQEKVKELMEQHYKSNGDSDTDKDSEVEDERMVYGQGCRDHQLVDPKNTPGSSLLSQDGIHPNDAGYDAWGRHIAAAIVRHWKQKGDAEN